MPPINSQALTQLIAFCHHPFLGADIASFRDSWNQYLVDQSHFKVIETLRE
jgi:hypothetical protein